MTPRWIRRPLFALVVGAAACSSQQSSASVDVPGAPPAGDGVATGDVFEQRASSSTSADIDTVVMIGDSITVASTPALQDVFESLGFETILIVAQQGKRAAVSFGDNPSGAAVARTLLDDVGTPADGATAQLDDDRTDELWIVALGTNDIDQYSDPSERVAAINEVLDAVPADVPLIWVDTYFRDRPDGAGEINDMVAARLRQRGNATIARWSEVADDEGNLRDDGVHPRDDGTLAFAGVVRDTVDAFLP